MKKLILAATVAATLAVPAVASAAPADYTTSTGGAGSISVHKGVATVSVAGAEALPASSRAITE